MHKWNSCDEQHEEEEYSYDYQPPGDGSNDAAVVSVQRRRSRRNNGNNNEEDQDAVRDAARLALEKYDAFENLNPSQQQAVEGAATNRLTLVQGPPGTGKTAVAIRIIQHWARVSSGDGGNKPILATRDSNIAVDNLIVIIEVVIDVWMGAMDKMRITLMGMMVMMVVVSIMLTVVVHQGRALTCK